MNIFNRIAATVSATVDKAVSQVENHDAVADAALQDTRAAAAKAQVRLKRVQQDGEHLRRKLQELNKMEQTWTTRAKNIAHEDEDKALQCIERRNRCREQAKQTQEALQRHEELTRHIHSSVERIENRLEQLTQQRNMLRSRHSAADAMRIIQKLESQSGHGLDDTLDRWEILITESEYLSGYMTETDALNDSFTKLENSEALRAELQTLLNEDTFAKESHHE